MVLMMMTMMMGRMKLPCVWLPVLLQGHAAFPWGPYRLPATSGHCVRVSGCVCLSALPEPAPRSPLPAPVMLRGKAGRSFITHTGLLQLRIPHVIVHHKKPITCSSIMLPCMVMQIIKKTKSTEFTSMVSAAETMLRSNISVAAL